MDAISICNAALLKLGATPITSFEAGTVESFTANKLYPIIKNAALSSHSWGFATHIVRLAVVNGEEQNEDEKYHYALPSDFLRVLNVFSHPDVAISDYEIRSNIIVSRHAGLQLKYIANIAEGQFPPHFLQALIMRLAAEFCLPITDSTSRMEALYRLSEQEFHKARGVDNLQENTPQLVDNSLLEARG